MNSKDMIIVRTKPRNPQSHKLLCNNTELHTLQGFASHCSSLLYVTADPWRCSTPRLTAHSGSWSCTFSHHCPCDESVNRDWLFWSPAKTYQKHICHQQSFTSFFNSKSTSSHYEAATQTLRLRKTRPGNTIYVWVRHLGQSEVSFSLTGIRRWGYK